MGVLYDFSGYATKNDIKCSDGRTIRKDAFIENDGKTVPLVWQHMHDSPFNVLGHALLENRNDGVYAYCKFNATEMGENAKELVQHGDITSMSIYANKLKQRGSDVIHGAIREVSLVLSPANPGASIQSLAIEHSDEFEDDRAIIYMGEEIELMHAEEAEAEAEPEVEINEDEKENEEMAAEKTVGEVFDELTDEQKDVVYYMIGQALEDAGVDVDDEDEDEEVEEDDEDEVEHSDNEGEDFMKYNVFENDEMTQDNTLSHAEIEEIFADARKNGSLADSALAHAEVTYGVENVDYLFPDAQLQGGMQFITRRMDWVAKVMAGVHRSPISRIKSIYADLTAEEARAKGYIKGKLKKEQVFSLLKRTTSPTTVYKKQKLDRDDVLDIKDFDIVAEIKKEMRFMLDEELATAFLVGDGRSSASQDKISESNIRPIWTDSDLFTIKHTVDVASGATVKDKANALVDAAVIAMDSYEGTGSPVLYAPQNWITQMLLLKDMNGHRLYRDVKELAAAMSVNDIVAVTTMKNKTRTDADSSKTFELAGLIVNLADYSVGADKGGAVNMFDDFDIDYNQMKYLIETRCSGSLTKPYSAIALEFDTTASA